MNSLHLNTVKYLRKIFLLLLAITVVFAENEAIELLHAVTMQRVNPEVDRNAPDSRGSYLMFDKEVHLKQGDVHLYADRVYQYVDLDILRLLGNVKIFDDSVTVEFEEGEYNTDTKDLEVPSAFSIDYDGRRFSALSLTGNLDKDVYLAKGEVEISDSMSYAYADSLRFDRENERAWLYGEAFMSDTVNMLTMRGSELEYRLDSDEFFGHKDASVYESNKDGKKRFEVFAGHLQGDMNAGSMIATQHVFVLQDSSSAWCDSLYYNDSLQIVEFHGEAHLRYQDIDMYGPEMYLEFYRDRLGTLRAPRDPRITLSEEGYIGKDSTNLVEKVSNVKAKDLLLKFNSEDQPEWMDVSGMVESEYHVFKDSVYKGLNNMTSDTLHIVFDDGEVADLFAIFGVEGVFEPDTSYTEMDTMVTYSGDEAHYSIKNDNMFVYPSSNMRYGNIKLKADTMKIDWKTNILYAIPGKNGERPEFVQNDDDPVYGDLFEYNLDTQRGRITKGKTNIDDGYYQGKTVLKTEDDPLYVTKGVFSTCDLEEPHFCVEAKKMKVIPGDRVFAQDLTLKVMNIPLLYIPSLFISIEEGKRRSGWIIPGFVRQSYRGTGINDFGYYWAPNDYYDARLVLDFYDGQGITAELRQRYALTHYINKGELGLKYWNNFLAKTPKQGFEISMDHSQNIGQKSRLIIAGRYTNDATRYEEEVEIEDQLEQQMISSGSFSTSLGPFNMSVSASHKQDLLTGNSKTSFPSLSISKSQSSLFKRKSNSVPEQWYHKIKYGLSSKMTNTYTHSYDYSDSTVTENDTIINKYYIDDSKNKMVTEAGVQYSDKIFGFLTVRPYMNYYEDWTMKYYAPIMQNDSALVDTNGTLQLQEINAFKRRSRYDMGASASTTFYGVFNLNIGPLEAIRHTLGMSINYKYKPDQSKNPDYVYQGYGTDGSEIYYDYFQNTGLMTTPNSGNQTFNMSFSHKFDAKTKNKNAEVKKINFLTLTHSINFLEDSFQFSNISARSSIRNIPVLGDLNINATFDPYAYRIDDEDAGTFTRINRLTIPRITSLRIGTSLKIKEGKLKRVVDRQNITIDSTMQNVNESLKPPKNADNGFSNWSISSEISYDYSASNPLNVNNKLLVYTTIQAQLTPKWKAKYKINFNVLDQKITDQRLSLSRDMHCWVLSLDYQPMRNYVWIRLNAKSSLLKDFKLLQHKNY